MLLLPNGCRFVSCLFLTVALFETTKGNEKTDLSSISHIEALALFHSFNGAAPIVLVLII